MVDVIAFPSPQERFKRAAAAFHQERDELDVLLSGVSDETYANDARVGHMIARASRLAVQGQELGLQGLIYSHGRYGGLVLRYGGETGVMFEEQDQLAL